jgi:hypothetical protein
LLRSGKGAGRGKDELIEIVLGAGMAVLFVLMGGIRRIPWRYAGLMSLGYSVVLAALRLSTEDIDPWMLVALGALGGGLTILGTERGERERARRSAAILARRPSTLS